MRRIIEKMIYVRYAHFLSESEYNSDFFSFEYSEVVENRNLQGKETRMKVRMSEY